MPTWLAPSGGVLLRLNVRANKYETLIDEVHLLEAKPQYAHKDLTTQVSLLYLCMSWQLLGTNTIGKNQKLKKTLS